MRLLLILRFSILLVFITTLSSCEIFEELFGSSSSSKPTTRTLTNKIEDVTFSPSFVAHSLKEFEIIVTPIDAREFNDVCQDAINFGGSYRKGMSFWEEHTKDQNLTYNQKNDIKMFEEVKKNLSKLVNRGDIDENCADAFFLMALKSEGYSAAINTFEVADVFEIINNERSQNSYNPYFLGSKPLSVFKITFNNKSTAIKKISLKSFTVLTTEGEQLLPYSIGELEKNPQISDFPEKRKNLSRFNLPDEIVVPPNTTIIKYFSIPGLDINVKKFDVGFLENDEIKTFNFNVMTTQKQVVTDYNEYYINPDNSVYLYC